MTDDERARALMLIDDLGANPRDVGVAITALRQEIARLTGQVDVWQQKCNHWERDYRTQEQEIERLKQQLPQEMQECTIVFKECEQGHGRLTATNWIEHGCWICRLAQAEQRITTLDTTGRLMEIRAERAEQERDRLKAVLKEAIDPDGYLESIIVAIAASGQHYHRPAIPLAVCEQAQQVLGQQEPS